MKQNITVRRRKSAKKGFTYEYRFETAPIGGKRQWISKGGFEDENAARIAGIKALNEYNTCGKVVEPITMSFADFLEHWLNNDCANIINETTLIHYRKKIKNLIVPYLGKYRVNTIDRDKVQNLLVALHDQGYSRNTLISVRGILTKCFHYGYNSGYLERIPATNLKIPRNENTTVATRKAPHVYLSPEQLGVIFNRFPIGHPAHLPLMVGLHCGLRLGETFALTWNDIDFMNRTISINKQIQWRQFPRTVEQRHSTNGQSLAECGCWYFSSTKYQSDRIIEMDEELYHLLSVEKDRQVRASEYYADRYHRYYVSDRREISHTTTSQEIHFVFVREDGSYITPRTMQHVSRVIHYDLKIEDFDFHSLRHTHATVLLEKGAPLKYIQQRLGHKKIEVTINVYQHLTEEMRKVGERVLNEMFTFSDCD